MRLSNYTTTLAPHASAGVALLIVLLLTACQTQSFGGIVPQLARPGFLAGHVNIGPLSPVQRAGETPVVPPEVYAARQIVVYKEDGKTKVVQPKIDDQGNYRVTLAPGVYVVDMARTGIDRAAGLPARITIESDKATVV
ncbi:MAG: hypothetical protein ACM3S0_10365, partial [Acidobacteriota bacterium]